MKSIKNLMMLAVFCLLASRMGRWKISGPPQNEHKTERILFMSGCSDGDTCLGHDPQRISYKLRLLGIDAPEIKTPLKKGQVWAKEAKARLNVLVSGKQNRVLFFGGDLYGRHLVIIYPINQSKSINETLIEEGHAFSYGGKMDSPHIQRKYTAIENHARKTRRGIWKLMQQPENPSTWRLKTKVHRTNPFGYEHL